MKNSKPNKLTARKAAEICQQFCLGEVAKKLLTPELTAEAYLPLQAVEKWLAEPTDENRRSAMKAANEAEFSTPAGSAALAVFFSGGSIAPPDMPAVPPESSITPNSVAGTVMLAAVLKEPEKAQEKYQLFLAEGLKIASIQ